VCVCACVYIIFNI